MDDDVVTFLANAKWEEWHRTGQMAWVTSGEGSSAAVLCEAWHDRRNGGFQWRPIPTVQAPRVETETSPPSP
jgi:hypothetical protein